MNSVVKAAIGGTVVLVLAVGGELAWLHHERNKPMVMKACGAGEDLGRRPGVLEA